MGAAEALPIGMGGTNGATVGRIGAEAATVGMSRTMLSERAADRLPALVAQAAEGSPVPGTGLPGGPRGLVGGRGRPSAQDTLPGGVAACDQTGRLTLRNAAAREVAGEPPPDATATSWAREFMRRYPDGAPLPEDEVPLVRALRGEWVREVELLVVGPDGRRRLFTVDGQPIIGPDGEQLGAVVALHAITARRRAERLRACELAGSTALAA